MKGKKKVAGSNSRAAILFGHDLQDSKYNAIKYLNVYNISYFRHLTQNSPNVNDPITHNGCPTVNIHELFKYSQCNTCENVSDVR